jgi:hypothetical protein
MTPIEPTIDLPISARAHKVALIEETSDGRWVGRQTFPLR